MALHHSLRDLVAVRGAGVVDEAEELRGALDDFLAEDEATLGEMNLLVDAVRLGALRRALDVMAHGADPEAAVREAGGALARDRGTDDPTRSCWALAALCFALGNVDESLVRTFRADAGTVPAPGPPTAPHGRAPEPAHPGAPGPATPVSNTGGIPATPVIDQPSTPAPPPPPPPTPAPSPTVDLRPAGTLDQRPAPLPPVIPERRASRAGTFLLVVLVALILGGLVAAGVILLRDQDDDPTATDDPSERASGGEGPGKPLIPRSAMLVPYVEDEQSRIYQVDTATGEAEPITLEGIDAKLPTISPDRRTMTYQLGGAPSRTTIVDLATKDERALFPSGPCATGGRPAWSPDGTRLAMLCASADDDEEPDGIWVSDSDGGDLTEVLVDVEGLNGSPTWISNSEFVHGQTDVATGEVSFWRTDIAGGEPEQLPIELDGHLSHIDWSPEKRRLLLLVSPDATEVQGDVWTMNADGSDLVQLTEGGSYAHPVWSDDGEAIGVTLPDPSTGEEVLGYLPVDDPDSPVVVPDPPTDQVGVPVWGSR